MSKKAKEKSDNSDKIWKNNEDHKIVLKEKISIRIDSDILEWFRNQEDKYQTYINDVLRNYVDYKTDKKG